MGILLTGFRSIKIKFQTKYEVRDYDRMFLYIWQDITEQYECKFGERWVFSGKDPIADCQLRVYNSLSVRKDLAIDGKIELVAIFDVTELAKEWKKYYKNSSMDDAIREIIGFRKQTTGEVHRLSGSEMKIKVSELLAKYGQPLPVAALSTYQYNEAVDVITQFRNGAKVVASEYCARFGKTIEGGVIAKELDVDLGIVASYVKTVFTSFGADMTGFEQFSNYKNINCDDENYKEQIKSAFKDGYKVFAYLSLANGKNRQKRINFLTGLKVSKMLIVDEADLGAKRKKQALPLIAKLLKIDYTWIITGTDLEEAIKLWQGYVDYMNSVTYIELLNQKRETKKVLENA
jgi:hypothetical protein